MVAAGKTVLLLEATTSELLSEVALSSPARDLEPPSAAAVSVSSVSPPVAPLQDAMPMAVSELSDDAPASEHAEASIGPIGIAASTSAVPTVPPPPSVSGRAVKWATVAFVVVTIVGLTATGWVFFFSN